MFEERCARLVRAERGRIREPGEQQVGRVARRGQNRQPCPRVGRVAPGDGCQGVQGAGLGRGAEAQGGLEPDPHVVVVRQCGDPFHQRGRVVEPRLRQADGVLDHPWRGIRKCSYQHLIRERLQPVQRPEDVNAGHVTLGCRGESSELADRAGVLAFEEEPVRSVAPPAVGVFERRDELGGRGIAQAGRLFRREAGRRDPVDPPLVAAAAEVEVLHDVERDVDRLDHLAAHVEGVERAVGRVHEVHGAEPVVRRADELGVAVDARRLERRADGRELHPVDQVVLRVADEGIAAEGLGVGGAPVDRDPGRRVDDMMAGARGFGRALAVRDPTARPDLPPALQRADPVDRHRIARHVRDRLRHGQVGVPRQVFERQHGVEQRPRLAAEEAVAEVVERRAELDRAGDGLEHQGLGVEAEVGVLDVDRSGLRVIGAADLASVERRRAVDLVVEPERQVVHSSLLVLGAEPGEDLAADVGDVVAVGVLEVPDVRRRRDEDASLPGRDTGGPHELVGHDVALVEPAVAVGVAKPAHGAQRVLAGPGLVRVVDHLGDVQITVLVERRRDRAVNQGFGGDRLEMETGDRLERLERLGRSQRREGLEERLQLLVAVGFLCGVERLGLLGEPFRRDARGGEPTGGADLEQDVARLLEVVEQLGLLGERACPVLRHLLVDLLDQAVEARAVVGGLAVHVEIDGVRVRLGIGSAGLCLAERPRGDPRRRLQIKIGDERVPFPLRLVGRRVGARQRRGR